MITVLIANQKGGTGKTTVSDELAFALERRGYSVAFVNLDPQGGAVHSPTMPDGTEDFQVVDTPGALNRDFQKWAKQADLILMPVLPSMLDLVPFQRSYKLLVDAKIPKQNIGVVVNRYDPRREVDQEFLEFLGNADYSVWGLLPTATVFAKASALRTSTYDIDKRSKGALAIESLAERVLKESGINEQK